MEVRSGDGTPPTLKSHIVIDYEGDTLTVRVNGKLYVAYHKSELVRRDGFANDFLLGCLEDLRRALLLMIEGDEGFRRRFERLAHPSVGACTVCGRHANLWGGLCYGCTGLHREE